MASIDPLSDLFLLVCLMVPAAATFLILRKLVPSSTTRWTAAIIVLGLTVNLVLFRFFPDVWREPSPQVVVEVILPDQYHGFVYLFFDSQQTPLQPKAPNVYSLLVPPSGRLRAGQYPGQDVIANNPPRLAVRYLNGEPAPVAEGSLRQEGTSRDGWSAGWATASIGSPAEFQAAEGQRREGGDLLEEMRREAASPVKKEAPTTLEGIERAPRGD